MTSLATFLRAAACLLVLQAFVCAQFGFAVHDHSDEDHPQACASCLASSHDPESFWDKQVSEDSQDTEDASPALFSLKLSSETLREDYVHFAPSGFGNHFGCSNCARAPPV